MIPFKPAEDLWSTLVPVAAMLLVLLAVAAAAVWYARRHGVVLPVAGKERRLRIVERLALSRRAMLLVVEYEGSRYLIGQSGDELRLISRAAPPADAPAAHDAG